MTEQLRETQAAIAAGLRALSVEKITLTRRIHDRHGNRPLATIEYSIDEIAAKIVDGIEQARREAYRAPELRR